MNRYLFISGDILLLLTIYLSCTTSRNGCKDIEILANADELNVDISTRRKNAQHRQGIDRVRVLWKRSSNEKENSQKFMDVIERYNITAMALNIRTDLVWETFKPKQQPYFQQSYAWEDIPRIPCITYYYQIVIPPYPDSGRKKCFATPVKSFLSSSYDDIRLSNYIPEPPRYLQIESSHDQATILWEESECAEQYDMYVDEWNGFDTKEIYTDSIQQKTTGKSLSTIVPNLTSCMKYEVHVFSKLSGAEIENLIPIKKFFYTKPTRNSLKRLDVTHIESNANSITLRFFSYKDPLKCLKNLTIMTCDMEDRCFQRRDVTNNNNGIGITYRSSGLASCTSYYLAINASYHDLALNTRKIAIFTKFDESKGLLRNYSPHLNPKYTEVEIHVDHARCIQSFLVYCQLAKGEKRSRIMTKIVTATNGSVTFDGLSPNSFYQISMIGLLSVRSGQEKNVSIFENLKFKTSKLEKLFNEND